ncbi:hypothetical protein [Dactylosporangium salmoneum]|uniref:Uncharacterized protein n=1 Tax=Dactylosporangium salmoneum TaxID=53361 RepID=A0ABN3H288_9ACTN
MTTLFVLDIDDFRPVATAAAADPAVTVRRRGPYLELTADGGIAVERAATGCRNAVWYSCVAAVRGTVTRWDSTGLTVAPAVTR